MFHAKIIGIYQASTEKMKEAIITQTREISAVLTNITAIKEAHKQATDWATKVDQWRQVTNSLTWRH
jgi:hypothetical protein